MMSVQIDYSGLSDAELAARCAATLAAMSGADAGIDETEAHLGRINRQLDCHWEARVAAEEEYLEASYQLVQRGLMSRKEALAYRDSASEVSA